MLRLSVENFQIGPAINYSKQIDIVPLPFECVFIIAVYNNNMCLQYADATVGSAAPSSSATSRSTFVTGVRNNLNSNLFGEPF